MICCPMAFQDSDAFFGDVLLYLPKTAFNDCFGLLATTKGLTKQHHHCNLTYCGKSAIAVLSNWARSHVRSVHHFVMGNQCWSIWSG